MNFEDMIWLFNSDPKIPGTRNIIRMDLPEAAMLWKCVRRTQNSVLEIGRNLGGSTSLLIAAANPRKVISIDISSAIPAGWERQWNKTQEFFSKHSNLQLIVGDSRKVKVADKLGFLFIDGDHTYEGVKADILQHWDSLGVGGLAAFHDAAIKSVPRKAINDILLKTGKAKIVEYVWSLLVVEKIN
mgnify:CR=1 FL=1